MNELLLIIRKTVRKKDDAEAAQAATDAKEYLFKVYLCRERGRERERERERERDLEKYDLDLYLDLGSYRDAYLLRPAYVPYSPMLEQVVHLCHSRVLRYRQLQLHLL